MKRTTAIATLFMLVFLSVAPGLVPSARAVEPENIVTYQGRLLNTAGVPVSDATADMEFYLYDQSTNTCLWSNDDSACATTDTVTVDLTDGLFTVNLGDGADTATIPTSVFADYEDVYLEVVVNGETLTPRKQITAAAYAVNSQTLDGLDSSDFLQNTGGSATGNYDFTGAVFDGASPLVFDGATPGGDMTTITVTDPTAANAIILQDGSGTVAFLSDIGASLWEDGTNGVFEDDEAVIVGADAAFSYASGGVGDLRVADEFEALSGGYFAADLIVGAATSDTETIDNAFFALDGDDLFVADSLGVEGDAFIDGDLEVNGVTGLFASLSIFLPESSLFIELYDETNATLAGIYVGDSSPDGALSARAGSLFLDEGGQLWINLDGATDWDAVAMSSALALDLDDVYDNDGDKVLNVDNASGLEFLSSVAGNIIFDLQSTGDLTFQDNNSTFLTISDIGGYDFTLDAADNPAYLITDSGSSNVTTNLAGTGDFVVQDNGSPFFTLSDSGAITGAATAASQLSTSIGTLTLSTTAGGAANSLILSSNDTSGDAVDINATGTGGGIDVDTADGGITMDAGGAVNGDISLTSGDDIQLTSTGEIYLNSTTFVYILDDIQFENGERIDNSVNEYITFTGAGGTDHDIRFDLTGVIAMPIIDSGTREFIGIMDGVLIGATAETIDAAGFAMGGSDDLFVAGMAGIEGNIYTDGSGYFRGVYVNNGVTDIDLESSASTATSGASVIGAYDEFANSTGGNVQDTLDDLDAAITSVAGLTLDNVYDNDGDKVLGVDNASGLEFLSSVAGNIIFDLQSTGDLTFQDNNSTFLTISDIGGYDFTLDAADNPAYLITDIGSSNVTTNLAGTGDFVVQDNGSPFFTLSDSGAITGAATAASQLSTSTGTLTLSTTAGGAANSLILSSNDTSGDAVDINATGTGGGIDVDTADGGITMDAGGAANGDITLTAADTFTISSTDRIYIDANATLDDSFLLQADGHVAIYSTGTAVNTIDLRTNTANGGISAMTNDGPVTLTGNGSARGQIQLTAAQNSNSAIDISATGPGNGGVNIDTVDGRIYLSAAGAVNGDVLLNAGDDMTLTAVGLLTFDGGGAVYLASDDDLIPTLGAGDADLGSAAAAWDNVYVRNTDDATNVSLSADGASESTSGASVIGVYDEFGNSTGGNVQDTLDDLDAAIAGVDLQDAYDNGTGAINTSTGKNIAFTLDDEVADTSFVLTQAATSAMDAMVLANSVGTGVGFFLNQDAGNTQNGAKGNQALYIDTDDSTEGNDIFGIETDYSSGDNYVFRIEADGEAFSDVGFTAGAFSTNYYDGEIQTSADMLLDINGGDLVFDQDTTIGDGADMLTINSSGTLTIDDATIAGTGALAVQPASGENLTIGGTGTGTTVEFVAGDGADDGFYFNATNGPVYGFWYDGANDGGFYVNSDGGVYLESTDSVIDYNIELTSANDVNINAVNDINLINDNDVMFDFGGDYTLLADSANETITNDYVLNVQEDAHFSITNDLIADTDTGIISLSSGASIDINSTTGTYVDYSTVATSTYIGTGTGSAVVGIATNAVGADTVTVGNTNAATTVAITGGNDWSIDAAGLITTAGDIAVNGDDITSDHDLTVNPAGGQLYLTDTRTFNVGGVLNLAYNAISNVGGSASGGAVADDNDLYVQGALEVDGAADIAGTLTVGDITCTDCLDFTEFADSMALDVSTSIAMDAAESFTITNAASGNVITNLTSTGDFVVQDNGSPFFTLSDAGAITGAATASSQLSTSTGTLTLSTTAGGTASSLILSSHDTSIDAIDIDSSGGIDIDTYGTGFDGAIDITADASDIFLTTNDAANGTIYLDAAQDLWIVAQNGWMQIFSNDAGIDMEAVEEIDMIAGQDGISMSNFTAVNTILTLTGGNFTDGVSQALFIDANEASAADDLVLIQSNVGGANNNVFRIEGDGEAFSDVGFTAGGTTNYYDGSVTDTDSNADDLFNFTLAAGADSFRIVTGNLRVGNGSPTLATNGEDAYIEGTLEVDGAADIAGTLNVSDITCTDCLDFTEFVDNMSLDNNLILSEDLYGYTMTSDLTDGSRATAILTLSQSNDASNIGYHLLSLLQGDVDTVDPALYIQQAGTGPSITINPQATSTSGALWILNTINNEEAIMAYSENDGDAADTLVSFYASNAAFDEEVLSVVQYGTGTALDIDKNGTTGVALNIASESQTSNVVSIAGSALTTGEALYIQTNDQTDDSGYALYINSGETTATADVFVMDTGVGGNPVFRIEADGEAFSDVGFTAGGTTNYYNGSITDTDSAADNLFDFNLAAAADSFRIVTGNLRVGDGSPGVALNGEDAYINGTLEVDGAADIAGTLTVADITCTDCLDFTEFADVMNVDGLTDIYVGDTDQLSIKSDISAGSRGTAVTAISQANDDTYSGGTLLWLLQQDVSTTSSALDIWQQGIGSAISISQLNTAGSGAVTIENTYNNTGALNIYTDNDGDATAPLVTFRSDNTAFDEEVLFIQQDGNGTALYLDSEATSANGMMVDASALTSGEGLYILTGNQTNDSGYALYINSGETTATADVFVMDTGVSGSPVFRIEAGGEAFSDDGFTVGGTTNYYDGLIDSTLAFTYEAPTSFTWQDDADNVLATLTDAGTNGTLNVTGDITCTDCLDFTDFADILTLDTNTTINANHNTSLYLQSDLTGGNRGTPALVISQGNDASYVGDSLLYLVQSDANTGTSTLLISNSSVGAGITINQQATTNVGALEIQNTNNDNWAINAYSNNGAAATNSLVLLTADNPAFDEEVLFIQQDGNGTALYLDSEATSANGMTIDASALTSGEGLYIVTGNQTDDSGYALYISSGETTASADVVRVDSGVVGGAPVFKIEASGETFSDVGFNAGNASTHYYDGTVEKTDGDLFVKASQDSSNLTLSAGDTLPGATANGNDIEFLSEDDMILSVTGDLTISASNWDVSIFGDLSGIGSISQDLGATSTGFGSHGSSFVQNTSTLTTAGGGPVEPFHSFTAFKQSVLSAGAAQIVTDAATVYIENQPAYGVNMTITNGYALWVDDGKSRFDGPVVMQSGVTGVAGLTVNPAATSANAVTINGSALTSGEGLYITTGNQDDDSGYALYINSGESTATADVVRIDTGIAGSPVFRIEADGSIYTDGGIDTFGNIYQAPATTYGPSGLDGAWISQNNGGYIDNTTAGGGTAAAFAFNAIGQPTLSASNVGVTTTDAATVYIKAQPAMGANMTITNTYALWVDNGAARFDGKGLFRSSLVVDSVAAIPTNASFGVDVNSFYFGNGSVAATNAVSYWSAANDAEGTLSYTVGDDFMISNGGLDVYLPADHDTSFNAADSTTGNIVSIYNTSLMTTGDDLSIDHTKTYTTTTSRNGVGLDLSRGLSISDGGLAQTLTVNGPLMRLSSNMTQTSGTITDNSSLLSLTQSYANATGSVLYIDNNATGASASRSLDIDSEQTQTTVVNVDASTLTTGSGLFIQRADSGTDFDGSATNALLYVDQANNNAGSDGEAAKISNMGGGSSVGLYLVQNTVDAPSTGTTGNQAFVIDVNEAGSNDDAVIIRSNVSGAADTEFIFESDGDAFADGAWTGAGADYAEYFASADAALAVGDLVALDGASGSVRRTNSGYDSGVVGVISTSPAFIGNNPDMLSREEAEVAGQKLVSLMGQVPVKVNDSNGAITVGDPITSSSTAGVGMKSSEPGQIVGFALEAMPAGSDTIAVYINPQYFVGNVIGTDGTGTVVSDKLALNSLSTATAVNPAYDSETLALRGSAWNGSAAEGVEMKLVTDVASTSDYHLSIKNTADAEVAYVTDDGTMAVSGDMIVSGKLYPSDQGVKQTSFYLYFDSSLGAGLEYMRTNAAGWSTGSYDFAEMFPSDDSLEAGDLVVFSSESEHVRRSTQANDTMVAGIVSTRPGFLAGDANDGDVPVALAGRVPTRVSLENGPISVGDPLTTSSTPGAAMKATAAGFVVGYALEPYDGTQGDNLVITYVNVGYFGGTTTDALAGTDNAASQTSATGSNLTTLDMDGDIYMHANRIVDVGELRGISGTWSIDGEGTIRTKSLVKTVIESYSGEEVETAAVTSPDVIITLTGTATLTGGSATIRFEDMAPTFNDVTSTVAPIRVFVTPNGPVSLYVTEKNNDGFRVQELGGSSDGVTFDWMVSAYRKDYEPASALVVGDTEETEGGTEVTEDITTETPPAEEPAAETPPAEEPVVEEPVVEEPVAEEPVVEEPVVEPPVEEPIVEEPVAEEPVVEEPVV